MDELTTVEAYLRYGDYPDVYMKGERNNLRWKCRKNYKFKNGMLYYKRPSETEEEEPWRICVGTETEKIKIMESCHVEVEGIVLL